MKVLVIGGTGTVGSQVVRELLARDTDIQVLTRSGDKAKNLPQGVEAVVGDLLNPDAVRSVFQDADAVFLINTVSPTECHEGLMAVNGIRMANVKRVVYVSVHRVEEALYLPHFGAKIAIEMAIKTSSIPYTILRPNNFFQNDLWLQQALLEYHVYPQPFGIAGVSRVDVRDIAEAAAIALTTDGHEGETYNLVGPEAYTGESSARVWSEVLGKEIQYGGNDLDAWEQQALQMMPDWMVFDFKQMFAYFQRKGFRATPDDIERQTRLLGHDPRNFRDFVEETAAMWKQQHV